MAKIPEYITRTEVEQLLSNLNQPSKRKYWSNERMRMLIILGFFGGMRISEIINLKVSDIDRRGTIYLRETKGKQSRPVGIDIEFCNEILDTFTKWKSKIALQNSSYLLQTGQGHKLERNNISKSFKALCNKVLNKSYSVHKLRHGYACTILDQTKNLYEVQKALGHSNISTTTKYLHMSEDFLKRITIPKHPHILPH